MKRIRSLIIDRVKLFMYNMNIIKPINQDIRTKIIEVLGHIEYSDFTIKNIDHYLYNYMGNMDEYDDRPLKKLKEANQ